MLQEFLNSNLLPITDEGYFEKLKKTSEVIAKKLNKNKAKVLSYTLAAIDPDVPANNPDVIEIKELIIKNWKTFLTNSKDTPLTYIRAVMLEALEIVSKETNFACLIWLTGRNIQKYFKLIGKEKELITNFLLALGNKIESKATESWLLPSESKLQKLSIEIKELTGVTIDKTTLQKKLDDASGPNKQDGTPNFTSPNPHWSNAGSNWSWEFAPRAAQGIADVVNKALKEQSKELSENQALIQDVVNKLLTQTQAEIFEKNSLLQMRAQLLWWKESCYSASLNQSYRGQPNGLLQILLANDYSTFVPVIYPTSVDYFLRETHRTLAEDENKKMKMSDILKQIKQSSTQLKTIFTEQSAEFGRISLLNFIIGFVWSKYTSKQLKNLVGISVNSEMTLSEFTLWLFHDLQSIKIPITK